MLITTETQPDEEKGAFRDDNKKKAQVLCELWAFL